MAICIFILFLLLMKILLFSIELTLSFSFSFIILFLYLLKYIFNIFPFFKNFFKTKHFKFKYFSFEKECICILSSCDKSNEGWFWITNLLFLLSWMFFNFFAKFWLSFIIIALIFWFFLFSNCNCFNFSSIFWLSNIWFFNSLFSFIISFNFNFK